MTTTWDPASITAVTLSGGNLVATNTGTTSADQGARVASTIGKTTGKYYFEVTWTTTTSGTSSNQGVGIGSIGSTYSNIGGSGLGGDIAYISGSLYTNGSNSGQSFNPQGPWTSGLTIGVAVDLDNRKIWFRRTPPGYWNSGLNPANDPATNVNGLAIPAGTMVPFVTFGGTGGTSSNVMTANFGGSAFSFAVPSGFTSGWPDPADVIAPPDANYAGGSGYGRGRMIRKRKKGELDDLDPDDLAVANPNQIIRIGRQVY